MLKPAICYKKEIEEEFDKLRYSEKAMYFNGCIEDGRIEISDEPSENRFQFAIVSPYDQLIGYISYWREWYDDSATRFGLITFKDTYKDYVRAEHRKTAPIVASAIREVMRQLDGIHRIEWRCVAGNHAARKYDRICCKVKGYRYRTIWLFDVFKDRQGNYRDCYIYELIKKED